MENEYYRSLPKKRMGAGVIFLNDKGQILIVKTTYKDAWTLPGGTIDENESPRHSCLREVEEELGLAVNTMQLLCIDYISATPEKSENIQFVFFGGVLSAEQISAIRLPPDELEEFRFLGYDEASPLLTEKSQRRIPHALKALENEAPVYLENSRLV